MAKGAGAAAMIGAAKCFGGIFNQGDTICFTRLLDRRDIRALAIEMDEDDRFG